MFSSASTSNSAKLYKQVPAKQEIKCIFNGGGRLRSIPSGSKRLILIKT
jgi:hypothetical protein